MNDIGILNNGEMHLTQVCIPILFLSFSYISNILFELAKSIRPRNKVRPILLHILSDINKVQPRNHWLCLRFSQKLQYIFSEYIAGIFLTPVVINSPLKRELDVISTHPWFKKISFLKKSLLLFLNLRVIVLLKRFINTHRYTYISKWCSLKELSLCHKLGFSHPYILLTWWKKPLIFQTQIIWSNRI